MKKLLLSLCFAIIPFAAQSSDLGPLGESNSTVTAAGYDQFRAAMETGIRELGTDAFIRILWRNGVAVNIPSGTDTLGVTTQRHDRILNPRNKNSLYRMVGTEMVRHALRRTPPSLPAEPLAVSVFVATATDTFNANRSAKIRAKIDSIQTPIDLSE